MNLNLPEIPKIRGIFITGTDTDVGKTLVAAGLTAALRQRGVKAGYFKPVQSGCPEENGRLIPADARRVRDLAELPEPLDLLTPVTLRLPLAPGVAAAREGVKVDLEKVAAAFRELSSRYDFLVVEGAGGLYVPLADTNFLVLDLARWLRLPLLVVARAGLGTINHTALTVLAARHAGLPVAGVILNRCSAAPGLAEQTNPGVIEALTRVPILGKVPEVPDVESPEGRNFFFTAMHDICSHADIFKNMQEGGAGVISNQ
ncbi:MAG: dethiobiotin synthase [Deltaproteobacteria bacterium]|nr:MAG: dethiobiotin synthase [Deltaproteobacteria bacterium]